MCLFSAAKSLSGASLSQNLSFMFKDIINSCRVRMIQLDDFFHPPHGGERERR